jgi:hypothetical protein
MECETREDSLTHKHVTVYTRRLEKWMKMKIIRVSIVILMKR